MAGARGHRPPTGRGFHRAVLERAGVALVVVDRAGVVRWHTAQAARFLGADDLAGRTIQGFCHPDDAERIGAYLQGIVALEVRSSVFVEVQIVHKDGTVRHVEVVGVSLLDDPAVRAVVLHIAGVTARVQVERELMRLAKEDPLTGLANRRVLAERVDHELARFQPGASGALGVLLLDLDRFKLVNDVFGHAMGDEVLVEVSRRLKDVIRPTDMAARLGGDEFAVLVGGRDREDVIAVTERILASLRPPMSVAGTALAVSACVGIATTDTATTPDRLFAHADAAMYRAKANGRGRWCTYHPDLEWWQVERHEAVSDLEDRNRALEEENRRLVMAVRTDPLTDLPNIVRQTEDLATAVRAAVERRVPFSVAFIDIDRFGAYNKRFGQHVGNDVLRLVGEALRSACRPSDTVYRCGGEEFAVLFNGSRALDAVAIAERMRAAVASLGDRAPEGVTVSVGVCEFDPASHADGAEALVIADAAMREAKQAGGDQVRVAPVA